MLVGFRNIRVNLNQCNIRLKGKGCHSENDLMLGEGSKEEWEPYLMHAAGLQDCAAGGRWPSGPAPFVLQFTHCPGFGWDRVNSLSSWYSAVFWI